MIRLRKYRIFLLVTVICLLAVYLLSRAPEYSPDSWPGFRGSHAAPIGPQPPPSSFPLQEDAPITGKDDEHPLPSPEQFPRPDTPAENPKHTLNDDVLESNDPFTGPKPGPAPIPGDSTNNGGDITDTAAVDDQDDNEDDNVDNLYDGDDDDDDSEPLRPHWHRQPEKFPVSEGSTIQLPTGTPKPIPRIQYAFGPESSTQKSDREQKLAEIKAAMQHTWDGYKSQAWLKDELSPQSGGSRDKFMGWGATLVDSLDTLWIMDMKTEFEEAVKAVENIDFTTGTSNSIPMFETTIRYLGGLLGAYDVSGAKYSVLLEKATQLAEILIAAFDTPNRMPMLYFQWASRRNQNPIRAGPTAVLAELGSLSLEFTRLAQLTNEPKYYDAVARISNGLADLQNFTAVPGLWPLQVDISGCKNEREDTFLSKPTTTTKSNPAGSKAENQPDEEDEDEEDGDVPAPAAQKDTTSWGIDEDDADQDDAEEDEKTVELLHQKDSSPFGEKPPTLIKRRTDPAGTIPEGEDEEEEDDDDDDNEGEKYEDEAFENADNCRPSGLQNTYGAQMFSIGGEGDSTYEYLTKAYLLLGGLEDKYRIMYETAIESILAYLTYRPMIDNEKRKLLFTGKFSPREWGSDIDFDYKGHLAPSVGHLSCFQGGMIALGSKVFNRPDELDIGSQFADGCVWAYESSASGIMPDDITPVACESKETCPWDREKWWKELDPAGAKAARRNDPRRIQHMAPKRKHSKQLIKKRQDRTVNPPPRPNSAPRRAAVPKPPTHEETVQRRIEGEGLWPGIVRINSDKYILRPEAIESVWYLYRITGDEYWRQKGWKMFQAVNKATKEEYGHSAIGGVSKAVPYALDEAESFWTAETLKYFYLLFSDPGTICLDDYVLNTEAHPFLRPDAKRK